MCKVEEYGTRITFVELKIPSFGEGILKPEGFAAKVIGKVLLELLGGSLAQKNILLP
jgi:hypothetical protein